MLADRWTGRSDKTADQLLTATDDGDGASGDARALLTDELSDGAVPAKAVHKAARDAGISAITLQRAKKALGVRSRKDGMAGHWVWEFPPSAGDHFPREGGHPRDDDPLDHLQSDQAESGVEDDLAAEGDHAVADDHLRDERQTDRALCEPPADDPDDRRDHATGDNSPHGESDANDSKGPGCSKCDAITGSLYTIIDTDEKVCLACWHTDRPRARAVEGAN